MFALQKVGQADAELTCDACEYATGDQRHEHEEKELCGIAARIVVQLPEQLLQLVEEALDIAVSGPSLVVRAGAGVV